MVNKEIFIHRVPTEKNNINVTNEYNEINK